MQRRRYEVYTAMSRIEPIIIWWQSITLNTKKSSGQDDTRFFTKVHLLAGKLVLVVVIHSLGGSRANWHHTPNPQSGATQPTQDEDHTSHEQSTRVAFGASPGRAQEPLTITMIGAEDNHLPPLDDPPITGLSRCQQTSKVTRSPLAQIAQLVPQDARTLSNALDALQSHSRWWNKVCKWVEWCA
jgi:hypothetical protein